MQPVSEASHYDSLAAVGRPRNLPTSIRAETHEPSMGRIDDVTVAAYRIHPTLAAGQVTMLPYLNLKDLGTRVTMYGPPSPLAFRFEPRLQGLDSFSNVRYCVRQWLNRKHSIYELPGDPLRSLAALK